MRDWPLIKPARVRIPTVLEDEWQDDAACAGKELSDIDIYTCDVCPVRVQCAMHYQRLNDELRAATGSSVTLDGVWGGKVHGNPTPERTNSGGGRYKKGTAPVNGGECHCGKISYRRSLCSKHYRKALKEE